MKKEINKILLVIGFIISVVGVYISAVADEITLISLVWTTVNVAVILALPFVFAKNDVVKNIGYILSLFIGSQGVFNILVGADIGEMVSSVGYIVMAVAALVYFIVLILRFFGFVKVAGVTKNDAVIDEINRYGEMKKEGIITEEEFLDIKQRLLSNSNDKKNSSMDDLKKWKKLLDQQVISEAEFADVKKDFLNNN